MMMSEEGILQVSEMANSVYRGGNCRGTGKIIKMRRKAHFYLEAAWNNN
jgi:hypothetical protein